MAGGIGARNAECAGEHGLRAASGGTVTLVCEGDKTVFTVDNDGALNGPQGGFLGRLTKPK